MSRGDGKLDREELNKFMKDKANSTGQACTDEIINMVFDDMDVDGNGLIDK